MQAAGVELGSPELTDSATTEFHAPARAVNAADRFVFGFVRHPLTWWASFWRYRMATGWDEENTIDFAAGSDSFDAFIRNVVNRLPGYLSRLYTDYLGPPDAEISFVGRYESLAFDLPRALALAGVPFDPARLLMESPVNVSEGWEVGYSPRLAERLLEAESEAVTRFYSDFS